MSEKDEIDSWITLLKQGQEEAAARIWEEFFPRVRALAARKMGALPQRERDAEDVALSAINAVCVGAKEGRFRCLEDSNDLWQLLAMITSRKAANAWRRQSSRMEVGESVFGDPLAREAAGIQQVSDNRDVQELNQTLSQISGNLMAKLDEKQRQVALMRLQGFSNDEIAQALNVSVRTIERYLKMIRLLWSQPDE